MAKKSIRQKLSTGIKNKARDTKDNLIADAESIGADIWSEIGIVKDTRKAKSLINEGKNKIKRATTFPKVPKFRNPIQNPFKGLKKKVKNTLRLKDVKKAKDWFKSVITGTSKGKAKNKVAGLSDKSQKVGIGKMVAFKYSAKHKLTLPYWDKFPLVVVIDFYDNGFLGLNLHYLPPTLRVVFLGKLFEILNNERLDKTTKFRATYGLLKASAKYKLFKPCIKRYLYTHVRSKFSVIKPVEWPAAIMLPIADFTGASNEKVWSDSKKIIKG